MKGIIKKKEERKTHDKRVHDRNRTNVEWKEKGRREKEKEEKC